MTTAGVASALGKHWHDIVLEADRQIRLSVLHRDWNFDNESSMCDSHRSLTVCEREKGEAIAAGNLWVNNFNFGFMRNIAGDSMRPNQLRHNRLSISQVGQCDLRGQNGQCRWASAHRQPAGAAEPAAGGFVSSAINAVQPSIMQQTANDWNRRNAMQKSGFKLFIFNILI